MAADGSDGGGGETSSAASRTLSTAQFRLVEPFNRLSHQPLFPRDVDKIRRGVSAHSGGGGGGGGVGGAVTLRPATTSFGSGGGGGGRRAYDAGAFSAGSQVDLAWFSGSTNREASLRAALERVAKQLALKRGTLSQTRVQYMGQLFGETWTTIQ